MCELPFQMQLYLEYYLLKHASFGTQLLMSCVAVHL